MRWKMAVASLAAACAMHAQNVAAQGTTAAKEQPKTSSESEAPKRPPVPVAKPAPSAADAGKAPDGKAADGPPISPTAQLGGALPLGSGERGFNAPDCRWTGSRVVHTLLREEVDAASQFTRFYSLFGCPGRHIGMALSCVVDWQGDPARSREERVDACWADPSRPRVQTAEPKENGKGGSEDKPPPIKN